MIALEASLSNIRPRAEEIAERIRAYSSLTEHKGGWPLPIWKWIYESGHRVSLCPQLCLPADHETANDWPRFHAGIIGLNSGQRRARLNAGRRPLSAQPCTDAPSTSSPPSTLPSARDQHPTMSAFALFSVPVAFFLTYAPHFAKVIVLKGASAYDNRSPRADNDNAKLLPDAKKDLVRRLASAHENQLEMLGVFAAGVAVCFGVGVRSLTLTIVTAIYVGARAAFVAIYAAPPVFDGNLRSLAFAPCLASTLALWFTAAATLLSR